MVVRRSKPVVTDAAAQRRAAQRQLAKEIKSGTYQPSKIGQAARKVVSERAQLVSKIKEIKDRELSGKGNFNQKRSDRAITSFPVGKGNRRKERSVKDLEKILAHMQDSGADPDDEWWEENDYEDVLYYH